MSNAGQSLYYLKGFYYFDNAHTILANGKVAGAGAGGRYTFHLRNGLEHRDDGPAVIGKDGSQHWLLNGKSHREDGPAWIVMNADRVSFEQWFLNNKEITVQVEAWILENPEIPHWKNWTDENKVLFKLRFS